MRFDVVFIEKFRNGGMTQMIDQIFMIAFVLNRFKLPCPAII